MNELKPKTHTNMHNNI